MLKPSSRNDLKYQQEGKSWCSRGGVGFFVCVVGLVGSVCYPSSPSSTTPGSQLELSKLQQQQQQQLRRLNGPSTAIGRRLVVEPRGYYMTTSSLEREVAFHDKEVREEADEGGNADAIRQLQVSSLELLHRRYGKVDPYRVTVSLKFPEDFPDDLGIEGKFVIDTIPGNMHPHAVLTFLEQIRSASRFDANVVRVEDNNVQIMPYWSHNTLAFPERITALEFPHNTMGSICFLKNGPGWVINTADNSAVSTETCFGHIVEGWEHILRLNHFEKNVELHVSTVTVSDMKLQVPEENGQFHIDWVEPVEPARR